MVLAVAVEGRNRDELEVLLREWDLPPGRGRIAADLDITPAQFVTFIYNSLTGVDQP